MTYAALTDTTRAIAETKLTTKQLKVFQLRQDGHSFRRIADSLNIDEATVRGHYNRAIKRLRTHLERKDQAA